MSRRFNYSVLAVVPSPTTTPSVSTVSTDWMRRIDEKMRHGWKISGGK
jgi:hypothetical protein